MSKIPTIPKGPKVPMKGLALGMPKSKMIGMKPPIGTARPPNPMPPTMNVKVKKSIRSK